MKQIIWTAVICGIGIVASITYIICLLVGSRKHNKKTRNKTTMIYEVIDDDTLIIPFNKS